MAGGHSALMPNRRMAAQKGKKQHTVPGAHKALPPEEEDPRVSRGLALTGTRVAAWKTGSQVKDRACSVSLIVELFHLRGPCLGMSYQAGGSLQTCRRNLTS